jgi:hypothetical protein
MFAVINEFDILELKETYDFAITNPPLVWTGKKKGVVFNQFLIYLFFCRTRFKIFQISRW